MFGVLEVVRVVVLRLLQLKVVWESQPQVMLRLKHEGRRRGRGNKRYSQLVRNEVLKTTDSIDVTDA